MTQQHPITPPLELRQRWINVGRHQDLCNAYEYVADRAAQWGYDQVKADIKRERQEAADEELEACIQWMIKMGYWGEDGQAISMLRAARRPKPKSEKQQALEAFDRIEYAPNEAEDFAIILRALESIPDEQ